jgi:hypothetical protein
MCVSRWLGKRARVRRRMPLYNRHLPQVFQVSHLLSE